MPRKLRTAKRRAELTLDDLPLSAILDFLTGWQPPTSEFARSRSRWQTWEEFDAEYALIREELLASEWTAPSRREGRAIFAERRYQAQQQGE